MKNSKLKPLVFTILVAMVTISAAAAERVGPVGNPTQKASTTRGVVGLQGGSGEPNIIPIGPQQCFSWKLGDQNQSGSTWVTTSDAYLYTGAGVQFTPNKHTAPEEFTPGPDLAGVIGVGFASPGYVPSSVNLTYSFLPVSRSSSSTLQPPPSKIGLTWFNEYGPGNTFAPSEQTVVAYPASGELYYVGFVPPVNQNTRYLIYVKTGDNGKGASANNRGFAAAGVICFNR